MTEKLHAHEITPKSSKWTCKMQIIDICRPAESKEKGTKYLNMIAQDEREDQIKAIIYEDVIPIYQKRMKLYRTYHITGGRVQPPYLKNEKPVHAFNWVLDRRCIIDKVKKHDVDALPLPTKLNTTSFQDIKHHVLQTTIDTNINEFDILAIVVNCAPPRYVPSVEKRIQELIVMNMSKETLIFTIWEEGLIEQEGSKLLHQFHQYPVILARRIGSSKYNGQPKMKKCLLLLPVEAHLHQDFSSLFQWMKKWCLLRRLSHNKMVNHSRSRQKLAAPLTFTASMCVDLRYILTMATIQQLERSWIKRQRLLSLTAEEIYRKTSNPDKDLHMEEIHENINNKLFSIRAKKAFARTSHTTPIKLYIQSFVEKQTLSSASTVSIQEGAKRKQQLQSPELAKQTTMLKMKQKVQPDTPPKNN